VGSPAPKGRRGGIRSARSCAGRTGVVPLHLVRCRVRPPERLAPPATRSRLNSAR
jgi:hypothetical protein